MRVKWGNLRLLEDNSAWNQQDLQNLKMSRFSGDWEGEREPQDIKRLASLLVLSLLVTWFSHSYARSSPIVLGKLGFTRNLRLKHSLQVWVCLSLWISGFVLDFNIYCLSLSSCLLGSVYMAVCSRWSQKLDRQSSNAWEPFLIVWKLRSFHTEDSVVY